MSKSEEHCQGNKKWRYGEGIGEADVLIYDSCQYETCSLCDNERKEKCNLIESVLKLWISKMR